ncbi:MAG: hypothetical protein Fues2KO_53820 [Fuerstiella sp.]
MKHFLVAGCAILSLAADATANSGSTVDFNATTNEVIVTNCSFGYETAVVSLAAGGSLLIVEHSNADDLELDLTSNSVERIIFYGDSDADYFDNQTALPTFAFGGAGDDTLLGGFGIDTMYGETGDDYLSGNSGDDRLYGGDDDDMLIGGPDDDDLFGDQGRDDLFGEAGRDLLDSGSDPSEGSLSGGPGADDAYETGSFTTSFRPVRGGGTRSQRSGPTYEFFDLGGQRGDRLHIVKR